MALLKIMQSMDNSSQSVLVAAMIVVLSYLLYLHLLPKPLPGIPHNAAAPRNLFGDGMDCANEVKATGELNVWLLKQVQKSNSPMVQVFVEPFAKPWILVADPIEAKDLLNRRLDWGKSAFLTDRVLPLGNFQGRLSTGETSKRTRMWLQDLASPTFLKQRVAPTVYVNSLNLIELWQKKMVYSRGLAFDVNKDLVRTTLDAMLLYIFEGYLRHTATGPQLDAISDLNPRSSENNTTNGIVTLGPVKAVFADAPVHEFICALEETANAIDRVSKSMFPWLTFWWLRLGSRYRTAMALKKRVIVEQVGAALGRVRATGKPHTAIEHMLMREQMAADKECRDPNFNDPVMIDELGGLLWAGLHTTSTALAWVLIYMTRHQTMQSTLLDDLHKTYDAAHSENRLPSIDEINEAQSPYLEAVIAEQFRLHAINATRQAERDTELLGHFIPKGTVAVVVTNGPGYHQPSLKVDSALRSETARKLTGWDETSFDMAAFEPRRWLTIDRAGKTVFDKDAAPMVAFGGGPRACWGRRFAMLELRVVLTLVFWKFELMELPAELRDVKATYDVVHRADYCYVRLRPRQSGEQGIF